MRADASHPRAGGPRLPKKADRLSGSGASLQPEQRANPAGDLIRKIDTRQAVVSVVGLGYVGLPLAVAFAQAGFRVIGIEVAPGRGAAAQRGESYIEDVPSETLRRLILRGRTPASGPTAAPTGRGCLRATTDHGELREADAVIICVPTPLGKTRDPDVSHIMAATDQIAQYLRPGMAVVLESTTVPGTTDDIVFPRLRSARGQNFVPGQDFFLAFSPERIDPGRSDWTLHTTPKVIGGVTPYCLEVITALYRCVVRQDDI